MIKIQRYHEIDCGHRVVNHESKCKHLHGHRYRINFVCQAPQLDSIGRIIDFSEIKTRLCAWLEEHWDHRLLLWDQDPHLVALQTLEPASVVPVPFNPTAENMADHLLRVVAPACMAGTGITVTEITINETTKCSATAAL